MEATIEPHTEGPRQGASGTEAKEQSSDPSQISQQCPEQQTQQHHQYQQRITPAETLPPSGPQTPQTPENPYLQQESQWGPRTLKSQTHGSAPSPTWHQSANSAYGSQQQPMYEHQHHRAVPPQHPPPHPQQQQQAPPPQQHPQLHQPQQQLPPSGPPHVQPNQYGPGGNQQPAGGWYQYGGAYQWMPTGPHLPPYQSQAQQPPGHPLVNHNYHHVAPPPPSQQDTQSGSYAMHTGHYGTLQQPHYDQSPHSGQYQAMRPPPGYSSAPAAGPGPYAAQGMPPKYPLATVGSGPVAYAQPQMYREFHDQTDSSGLESKRVRGLRRCPVCGSTVGVRRKFCTCGSLLINPLTGRIIERMPSGGGLKRILQSPFPRFIYQALDTCVLSVPDKDEVFGTESSTHRVFVEVGVAMQQCVCSDPDHAKIECDHIKQVKYTCNLFRKVPGNAAKQESPPSPPKWSVRDHKHATAYVKYPLLPERAMLEMEIDPDLVEIALNTGKKAKAYHSAPVMRLSEKTFVAIGEHADTDPPMQQFAHCKVTDSSFTCDRPTCKQQPCAHVRLVALAIISSKHDFDNDLRKHVAEQKLLGENTKYDLYKTSAQRLSYNPSAKTL
eukprot:Clim_evm53s236 gene=Clim_evmTU53s236